MGRSLPRIPEDNGSKILAIIILVIVICGGLVAYSNYQAADQGGTGASQTHQKRVPSETVQDSN